MGIAELALHQRITRLACLGPESGERVSVEAKAVAERPRS